MVDIYGRPFTRKPSKTSTDVDLSKNATKEIVDELLNLAGVDPDDVVIFQDKQGKLQTSNIKWNDIIRRVLRATTGNFAEFTDGGRIKDSDISIKDINDKITKSIADRLKTNGDTMIGELSLGGNKITVLRDPTSAENVANKQYVDTADTATNNTLSTLRTDIDKHVDAFKKFRNNNYQPTYKIINDFFGEPRVVDMNLAEIKH